MSKRLLLFLLPSIPITLAFGFAQHETLEQFTYRLTFVLIFDAVVFVVLYKLTGLHR